MKIFIKHLMFLLILPIVLLSCQKKDIRQEEQSQVESWRITPLSVTTVDHESLRTIKMESSLEDRGIEASCYFKGASSCLAGITRIFNLGKPGKTEGKACTGILFSTGELVTNAHCLNKPEQGCDKLILITYNARSETFERIQCKGIKKYLNRENLVDYAVLETEIRNGQGYRHEVQEDLTLPMNTRIPIVAWPIDSIRKANGANFRATRLECSATQRERGGIKYLAIRGCPLFKGNSGSPIFHAITGQFLGVAHRSALNILEQRGLRQTTFLPLDQRLYQGFAYALTTLVPLR